jgi:hypothetical protein
MTTRTVNLPNPGEVWKDDNFDWGTEPHIGTVTIVLSMGGLTSYIKENGDMGVMSTRTYFALCRWVPDKPQK